MTLPFRPLAACSALAIGLFAVGCGGSGGGKGVRPAVEPASESAPAAPEVAPAGPAVAVECGDFTTCALAEGGQVQCWGRDKGGELGGGTAADGAHAKRRPVPGLSGVREIALASQFGCALVEGGSVRCWGTGRIANDGKRYSASKPVPVVGIEGAEELSASGAIACARSATGITCWGADEQAMGRPPTGKFKQITTGFTHGCALDDKGAVVCWGQGDWAKGGPYAKPSIVGAREVVVGDRHGCVVKKDRRVACWGMNDAGQLGIAPDVRAHRKPVVVPGVTGVTRLVAGEASTCAVLDDGSVRCWGSNGEGELGLGTRSSDERPTRVGTLSQVEQLCLATAHGCALAGGRLLCWGANGLGQLGDGTTERRTAPTPVAW